jgi:hypothetical protein
MRLFCWHYPFDFATWFVIHGTGPAGETMFLINFPLMIIPFAVYDFFIIGGDTDPWNDKVFALVTGSGALFTITLGHVLILLALLFLLIEVLKTRSAEISTTLDHVLSFVVLTAYVTEFFFLARAATSTFFLLMMITLVSLLASILLSMGKGSGRLTIER